MAKYSIDPENKQQYKTKEQQWKNELRKPEFLPLANWEEIDVDTISHIQNELSLIPEYHQRILIDAGVEIEIVNTGNSFYDPRDRKIRIIKEVEDYEVIHEVGHALEDITEVWDDPEFREILVDVSKNHKVEDIITDSKTYIKPICRISDNRFVSEYQGRVYLEAGEITKDGYVNPNALWDYFSEGYSCFLREPELLKTKDKKLYAYIERSVRNENK